MKKSWECRLGKLKIRKDALNLFQKICPKFGGYPVSGRGEIKSTNFERPWE
jgi:hypothetical protein